MSGARTKQFKGIDDKLEEEALWRLEDCRRHKAEWELDMREAYFFAAPHRSRHISSRQAVGAKPRNQGESNISFACEMASDFATVIVNTFIPEAEHWAQRKAGFGVPDAVRQQISDKVAQQDEQIFDAISASNFYSECATSFIPDIAVGTVAMWIDAPTAWQGNRCQAIPLHELEIGTGPDGKIDDRFFVQHTTNRKLKSLIPKVKLPEDMQKSIDKNPKDKACLIRGFWRCWDEEATETWQYVVLVDDILVAKSTIKGQGAIPLIVARFNPMKEWAFGNGPLIQSLPDLRHLDELAAARIQNCDLALRPPVTIPDDSMVNFEEGIEAGMAYPIRPGSENAIKNIYEAPPATVGIYAAQEVEQRVKRLHFLDWPEQRGDTPPSATQWLDQMTMAQRRIGTPGLPFWEEWCVGIFQRFVYLLTKAGHIEPVKVDGKNIALVPYNPAMRAAEQQEVAQASRAIELGGQAFPEEFKATVDGKETFVNIVKKLGADKIIVMRKAEDIQNAVQMLGQLTGGAQPGAPDAAMAGAPAAPNPAAGSAPAPAALPAPKMPAVTPMSARSRM
jgi:hypothetical protein